MLLGHCYFPLKLLPHCDTEYNISLCSALLSKKCWITAGEKKLLNVGQTYKSSKATKPYVQTENLWRFDFRRKTLTLEEPKSNLCLSDLWILEAVYATARVSGEIECLCMRNLTYKLINEQHIFFFCWLKWEMKSECQVAAIIALCTWHWSSGSVVSIINPIFQVLYLGCLKSCLAETDIQLVSTTIGDLFPHVFHLKKKKKILT